MGQVGKPGAAVRLLVRFAHVVAEKLAPREILPLLAEEVVQHVEADGAAVFEVVESGGAHLAAGVGLPEGTVGMRVAPEAIGAELVERLLAASGGAFAHAELFPLVSSGDLFGALVVLRARRRPSDDDERELIAGVVDLAAIALRKAYLRDSIERSHAERRASQDVLFRSEKLRALGQMAAGIAHDLRNILAPFPASLHLIRPRVAGNEVGERAVERMQRAVARGVQLIDRLRGYGRPNAEAASTVELDPLLEEAAELCRTHIRAQHNQAVRLEVDLGHPPDVVVEPIDLISAVLNLLVNAVDALADSGGTVTVRSRAEEGGSRIEIVDDGPGLPDEIRRHLFEPFFTTKGDKGTGLGLTMVNETVQRAGGRITVESSAHGTAFALWLPGAPAVGHTDSAH